MDKISHSKDIDNIIYSYVREVRPIDISKINKQIKAIQKDKRRFFQFHEDIIYYDEIKFGKYVKLQKMMMIPCCYKCGNYLQDRALNSKIICKCRITDDKFIKIDSLN